MELFRAAEAKQPGAFGPYLSQSLSILGDRLQDTGDWKAAIPAYAEAVQLLRPYAEQYPQVFRDQLVRYAQKYANACDKGGVQADQEIISLIKTNVFKGWK